MRIFKKKAAGINSLMQELDHKNLPEHVAIIMDGNGRWAQKRKLPRSVGHRAGVENVRTVIRLSSDLGIKALTLFAFSTENWKRPQDEVNVLMDLLVEYIKKELNELNRKNTRIKTLGDLNKMPKKVADEIDRAKETTKNNTGLIVNMALNYGSRQEMVSAVKKIASKAMSGEISIDEIDENTILKNLYTADLPEPDLIIRTSGENRLSNFLLYQAAYSEFIFTKTLWPDFNEKEYLKALIEFEQRQRRFGAI
ncbi:MAG: isoprenyl transferase [Eubacteriales bacterium]